MGRVEILIGTSCKGNKDKLRRDWPLGSNTDFIFYQVFRDQGSTRVDENHEVAESIFRFFPGFQAFKVPPPAVNEEVLKNINRNKSQINPDFLSGIEDFKRLLRGTLVPKHSFNDGEIVTGEGR